jgi:ABC-type multidrug transport system permease subunit
MFFGNVLFPAKVLPPAIAWVSDWFPMSWSLRIVRGALLQGVGFHEVSGPLLRLAVLTALLVPAGLYSAKLSIRKAKQEGSLVQY